MKQYHVTGMSCAACQSRVEKAVCSLEGVDSCAVSLLTNSMGVEGNASSEMIIKAVEAAGYGASLKQSGMERASDSKTQTDSLADTETPRIRKRLIASLFFLLPLMYVSMGHMLWNLPLPGFLEGNQLAIGIYEMLLAGAVMVINQKFFINGFKGLLHKAPNMDTLVALGASASYGYSIYALFAMTGAVAEGRRDAVMYFMDQFYFESAAMILTLITVGKMLEANSKGKTTNALRALMNLAPQTAVLLVGGEEKTVPIEEVAVGDRFVVRPGDSIPVDGIIIEGTSAVNEAALTGESVPAEKMPGDRIFSATINTSGYLVCEAVRVGEDTTLSGIIRMVSDAAATKAPIAKIADTVSGVFVPVVMGIALVTFLVWMLLGQDIGYAVARAVCVLVISCPCALGLATPVAIMVGNGIAAKSGILFKTSASLEQAGRTQIVALDKTGTITTGNMQVTDLVPAKGCTEKELLEAAYALEAKSEHPISKAIRSFAESRGLEVSDSSDFAVLAGNGLMANINGKTVRGGNRFFVEKETGELGTAVEKQIETLAGNGKTPVLFAEGDRLLGIIAVADTMKPDSPEAIDQLKRMGLHVVMLTGDNEITAAAIARQAGVDEVVASVKPDGKESVIRQLMEHGKVAMVGDGINDAPALTRADLGIAIGAGTDIAIDAADVVLMKNSIMDVAAAIRISRAALRNIHENLFWAFFYNCLGIPLAAGCYAALFGWSLNPMFGAAAMGLSSFCVVSNALRLNFMNVHDASRDKRIKTFFEGNMIVQESEPAAEASAEVQSCKSTVPAAVVDADRAVNDDTETINNTENRKEEKEMKITVKGMMCAHCEAHVKKALEAIEGIESVSANHDENLVTITNTKDIDEAVIKAAVEDCGYEYCGIL